MERGSWHLCVRSRGPAGRPVLRPSLTPSPQLVRLSSPCTCRPPLQWKDSTSTIRKKFLYQYILLLLLCHKNNEMLQMTSLCLKNLEFG